MLSNLGLILVVHTQALATMEAWIHLLPEGFYAGLVATIVGGLILGGVFLLLKDIVFGLPQVSGHWLLSVTTAETSYRPFEGMKLFFLVLLWQEGPRLHGTGEKVFEDANGRTHNYIGEKRTLIRVNGYITKRYFRRDRIVMHIEEQGRKRQSSSVHMLIARSARVLKGEGVATAADQSLLVAWNKGKAGEIAYGYAEPTTRTAINEC